MKKLMVTITAVASAIGLYADGDPAVVSNSTDFAQLGGDLNVLNNDAGSTEIKVLAKATDPEPIVPGQSSDPMPQAAAEAQAAEINKDPMKYIKAPDSVETSEEYVNLFKATTVQSTSESGKYVVTLELKPESYTTLSNQLNAAVQDVDVAASLTDPERSETDMITVIPGLYYRVIGAQSVDFKTEKEEGIEQLARTDEIQLGKPMWGDTPTQAFFKIAVSVTPTRED